MSSPRPHGASRRSRSWAKPSARRCMTSPRARVGVLDGAAGLVDEADLDLLPAALEALGVREERVVVTVAVGRGARAGRGGAPGVAGGRVARAGVADRWVAGGGAGRRRGGGGRGAPGGGGRGPPRRSGRP